jgi:hypothetical protein
LLETQRVSSKDVFEEMEQKVWKTKELCDLAQESPKKQQKMLQIKWLEKKKLSQAQWKERVETFWLQTLGKTKASRQTTLS